MKLFSEGMRSIKYIRVFVLFVYCATLISCGGGGEDDGYSEIPDNLNISQLSFDGLTMEFDPNFTGPYELSVENEVKEILINIETDSKNLVYIDQVFNVDGVSIQWSKDYELPFNLIEGENVFWITVVDEKTNLARRYTIIFQRSSATARLTSYTLHSVSKSGLSNAIATCPNFNPNQFEYQLNVGYDVCAIASKYLAQRKNTSIQIDDTTINEDDFQFKNILAGTNYINTYLVSEDQSRSERYSLEINRVAPTDLQYESNAKLSDISVSSGKLDYICGINQYSINLNKNTDYVDILFTPEVEGASIVIDDKLIDHEQSYRFFIDDEIKQLTASSYSSGGNVVEQYQLTFIRGSRNLVEVSTAEELQSALINAEPNDDIVLSPGDYNVSELNFSGASTQGFYSNRSGSDNEAIFLRSRDSDKPARLIGDISNNNAVLSIEGKHWNISNLVIQNARNLLRLASASEIKVRLLEFSNSSEDAIVIENSSSKNTIALSSFTNIGTSADQDSDTFAAININSDRDTAINDLNSISRIHLNTFSGAKSYTPIEIQSSNEKTDIAFNRIYEQGVENLASVPVAIRTADMTTDIRYNDFNYTSINQNTGPEEIPTLIQINDTTDENSQSTIRVFKNQYKGVTLNNFIQSYTGTNIQLSENLQNTQSAIYAGPSLDTSFVAPHFKIQLADDPQRCLGTETITSNSNEYERAVISDCTKGTNTLWELIGDNGNHVLIKNAAFDEGYLSTRFNFYDSCSISDGIFSANVYLDENNGGWAQRWMLDAPDQNTYIRSRTVFEYGLSVIGFNSAFGTPLSTCALVPTEQQAFHFVESALP